MRILVACEESQAVTIELRKLGHEAYSCDIIECSGGHPEWHIQGDAIETAYGQHWDMMIAHPPCTYLTTCCNRAYSLKCTPKEKVDARIIEREKAFEFFMKLYNSPIKYIAIENPQGYMNTHFRKPDQTIHPYYFGDNAQKKTCLWLKNLKLLTPTDMLPKPEPMYISSGEKTKGKAVGWCEGMRNIKGGQAERAKARSKTFPGIAQAMATQWTSEVSS